MYKLTVTMKDDTVEVLYVNDSLLALDALDFIRSNIKACKITLVIEKEYDKYEI